MQFRKRHVANQFFIIDRLLIFADFFRQRRFFIKTPFRGYHPVFQLIRHILAHFIFQQLFHQFRTRVFFLAFLIDFFRKKHTAFNVYQRRRHYEKFTHDIHVFRFHLSDIVQILLRNLHNRNIINVYFIFID